MLSPRTLKVEKPPPPSVTYRALCDDSRCRCVAAWTVYDDRDTPPVIVHRERTTP